MKNFATLIRSSALVLTVGFGLLSCKDDDPPSPPAVSFADTEMSVNEGDGIIEVEVILDKPFSKDLIIDYETGGTAGDRQNQSAANADYEILGDYGEVTIESGETVGVIRIQIYNDAAFEPDETIEIRLFDTNTDEVVLSENNEIVITILNDDEQLTANFGSATLSVRESDDALLVPVVLDKPAHADIRIQYTLEGTAIDSVIAYEYNQTAGPQDPIMLSDYYIHGVKGELIIEQGQTTGNIEIRTFSDFLWEPVDETIVITLSGGEATIGDANVANIALKQEDGKIIVLLWEGHDDVDMDLILWVGEEPDNLVGWLTTSLRIGSEPPEELIFLPYRVMEDEVIASWSYGLSYVYYDGTADPMNFEVQFADFIDGLVEAEGDREIFQATYTLANINKWDLQTGVDPLIAQTFKIVDGNIADISDPITVHAEHSRLKPRKIPQGFKREKAAPGIRFGR